MTPNFSPQNPIQPLSVGNVVTAGFRIYRSHLKSYFLPALIACLWTLLPILYMIPAGVVGFTNFTSGNRSPTLLLLLVLIGLFVYIFALSKYLVNAAIISRLALGELVNQPEPVGAARRAVAPKLWSFFSLVVLLLVIFLALFILFLMIILIPVLNIILFIPALILLVWLTARFFLADIMLAIEDRLSSSSAINRSWELTDENSWRLVLILFVAFWITMPIQLLIQIISRLILNTWVISVIREPSEFSIDGIVVVVGAYLLILGLGLLTNALILPFWQAIKAVVYYDLRSRREGLGLQLRDRTI